MNDKLCNLVSFDIGRLFNGAVDVDWLLKDQNKAAKAAASFVFHGPGTHGVASAVADGTGHRLVDTASFTAGVSSDLANPGSRPFTLAIASYGSGKSHLAVTLSQLLSNPGNETANTIVRNIDAADPAIAHRVEDCIRAIGGPALVLTLNGMNNTDLASMMISQLKEAIAADGHSIEPLESLRKRFLIAANLLGRLPSELSMEFVKSAGLADIGECRDKLLAFNEPLYNQAQTFFRDIGLSIKAIGDETVKDVLDCVVRDYLGPGKPYARLLILFDEFGHYLEFAASKPQVAGDGALQHLFEGVQTHSDLITFVGFIQFELKSYIQRLGSLVRNEAERYVTRYDSAEKYYLSSNLETLVASLLNKNSPPTLDRTAVESARERIVGWYESAKNDASWSDPVAFAKIARGCWPLSPEAMWVLYYISSGGRFLQQRSALSLLKSALDANADTVLDDEHPSLSPVALWTNELHDEFIAMENSAGAASTVVQSYDAVYDKTAQHLTDGEKDVLRALVLIEKTRLRAMDREDMENAISLFAGMDQDAAHNCLAELENEKNVIAWDKRFHRFEIFADTGSKPLFLQFLRQKGDMEYDEERRNGLFSGRASTIGIINTDLHCGFAEERRIFTQEWDYEPRHTTWALFRRSVSILASQLQDRNRYQSISEKRGFVVYCFVSENEDETVVLDEAQRLLRKYCSKVPLLLVLLMDRDRRLSGPLVQLDILDSLTEQDKAKFDRLVPVCRQEQEELLERGIREAIQDYHVLYGVSLDAKPSRLKKIGDAVFEKVFPKTIPFPFDGYSTKRGNGAQDCANLTRLLFLTDFSWGTTQSMGPQGRNRAQSVLGGSWSVVDSTRGTVSFKRAQSSVKSLMEEWDKKLYSDEGLSFQAALEQACSAPYGANIASAGLLLSVFFRAHVNAKDIQVMSGDDAVDILALSDIFPDKKPFDPDAFGNVRFIKAVDGESSPWHSLVEDWEDCISYREKAAFKDRIDHLRETNPVIPPQFKVIVQEIETSISQAQLKMHATDETEGEHFSKIEYARNSNDIFKLAYGASLLTGDLKSKMSEPRLWDREQDILPLEDGIRSSRQWIIAGFSTWLDSFNPHGTDAMAVANYRQDRDKMLRNLHNLELSEQEEQLRKKVERTLKYLESIAAARTRKQEAEAWYESHAAIPSGMVCAQMDVWKAECERHRSVLHGSIESMKTVAPGVVDEIRPVYNKLGEIRDSLSKARQALDRRAGKIFGMALSPETARDILDEIDAIVRLYEGSPKNQEDFRDARIEVNDYIVLAGQLSNIETSEEVFRERVERAKTDFVEKFTEIEPPWEPQDVYDKLVAACEKSRALASKAWVSRMLDKYADPSNLSPQETIAAQNELARRIPCFNPRDASKLAPVEKALVKHRDKLGVDSLVAQFNALSPTAQKLFLTKINSLGKVI